MKIIRFLSRISTYFAMVTVTAMMLLTVTDVTMRYFLNRPIIGTTEIVELMMVCMLFGMIPAALEKRHIKADFVIEHLPDKIQAILDIISTFIGIILVAIMAWQGFEAGLFARSYDLSSSMLEIPTFPIYMIMVLGFVLLCLVMVGLVIRGVSEVLR